MLINIQYLEKSKVFCALYNQAAKSFPNEQITEEKAKEFWIWWGNFIFRAINSDAESLANAQSYFKKHVLSDIQTNPYVFTSLNVNDLMNPNLHTPGKNEFQLHINLNSDVFDSSEFDKYNNNTKISAEKMINELRAQRINEINLMIGNLEFLKNYETENNQILQRANELYASLGSRYLSINELNNIVLILTSQVQQFERWEKMNKKNVEKISEKNQSFISFFKKANPSKKNKSLHISFTLKQ
ncbi:MAG: hypothetical protein ACD_46C00155G0002 [uncultured bacterium]|nr:MAG: hypothetical protein ACD_46C00155G0002 [uncultured bacterium]